MSARWRRSRWIGLAAGLLTGLCVAGPFIFEPTDDPRFEDVTIVSYRTGARGSQWFAVISTVSGRSWEVGAARGPFSSDYRGPASLAIRRGRWTGKGQSSQVKDFGKEISQAHQSLNQKLQQLASQKNIQLPQQLDARHQMRIDQLSSLSGQDFDKRFLSQQVLTHKKDVALYQQAAANNTDQDVKSFAQSNLPAMRQHLQMAQQQSGSISEAAGAQGQDQSQQGQSQQDQSQQGQSQPSQQDQSQQGQSQQGQQDQSQQGQQGQQSSPQ